MLAALTLVGCTQHRSREFDDRPRQDVWDAVVQASREPRYGDWIVTQNQVHVDDSTQTVHVYRDLKRDLVTPGLDPHREEQTWRFAATILPGEPTTVEFSSPDWALPAHFWSQADHFFAQVRMRLAEMGPVTPLPGDPMAGGTPRAKHDPNAPGDTPPPPKGDGLATP